jgi:hypothetical protein
VHFIKKTFSSKKSGDISQKEVETSLIEKFLYPKLGPGQLWEHTADMVRAGGGEIHFGLKVDRINVEANRIVSVEAVNEAGERITYTGDYFHWQAGAKGSERGQRGFDVSRLHHRGPAGEEADCDRRRRRKAER